MKTKYYGYLIVFIVIILLIYYSIWVYVKVNNSQNIYFYNIAIP